jgi:Bacterial regulatory proteins, lacI family
LVPEPGERAERVAVRAVAAQAGLSLATVSRVLDGGGNVAPRTRERVREVVDRFGRVARTHTPARTAIATAFLRVGTIRLERLCVLVFIEHGTRRIHTAGITVNPDGPRSARARRVAANRAYTFPSAVRRLTAAGVSETS